MLSPFRLMRLSTSIWGSGALEFDEQRWPRNGGMRNPKGYHLFGGHMHCPGRTLAKQELSSFVATVRRKYDVEPLGDMMEEENNWKSPWCVERSCLGKFRS